MIADRSTHAADTRELVIVRTFDAPRDLVFKAWSDPEMLKHWWGPQGFTLPFLEMDQRVGGKWRACMRGPDGTYEPLAARRHARDRAALAARLHHRLGE